MTTKQKFKLRLKSLRFVSAVDFPAQQTATMAIVKRDSGDELSATMRIAKVSE
jgi:hypothetical protein